MAAPNNTIAEKWEALSGVDGKNWETLISDGSIDNDLREYLVHYGQRVEAVFDSYNDMPKTQGYSLNLFKPEDLFPQTGLVIGNQFEYIVTDLLYARSGHDIGLLHGRKSEYMGYVAVATDKGASYLGRRDILICWRGTILLEEWLEDGDIIQVHARDLFGNNSTAKVHQGFLHVYTRKTSDDNSPNDANKDYTQNSAREQVVAAVKKHVDYYANTLKETKLSITVAGHSLGAAIATLNSMDIVSNGYNKVPGSDKAIPVTTFVSGCPRVGNKNFQILFDSLSDMHLLNIRNRGDHVPDHPINNVFHEYDVVGTVLDIDVTKTEDLKDEAKVWPTTHMPNIYLYAIASSQGIDKVPKAIDTFDMAIVNKNDDFLKDSFKVPKSWFQSVVKHGMVQLEDTGKWEQHYDYVPPVPAPVAIIPPN